MQKGKYIREFEMDWIREFGVEMNSSKLQFFPPRKKSCFNLDVFHSKIIQEQIFDNNCSSQIAGLLGMNWIPDDLISWSIHSWSKEQWENSMWSFPWFFYDRAGFTPWGEAQKSL